MLAQLERKILHIGARAGQEGWPEYSAEQLLVLDPDWLVSPVGDPVCELQNVQTQRAFREGRALPVDADLLGDPGLRMLDAANALTPRSPNAEIAEHPE